MFSRDRVEAMLASHKDQLFDCISGGVSDYVSLYPPSVRKDHTARTRASLRHDHIVARVRKAFGGARGVEVTEIRGLVLLVVDSLLAIRFHKLDDDGHCHSNDTAQTSLFHNQAPLPQQAELKDIPAHATHLIGGYRLNPVETAAGQVSIACPNGSGNLWEIELTAAVAPIVDLVSRRAEEQPEKKTKQVRGRKVLSIQRLVDGDESDS